MGNARYDPGSLGRPAWNAGQKVGVKKPLKQRQVWAIRFFLDREERMRDRALFDLVVDSKLRGCDLVKIKIGTLVIGQEVRKRGMVVQQKTGRPVQFEITAEVRTSLLAWLERRGGTMGASFHVWVLVSQVLPDDLFSGTIIGSAVDEYDRLLGDEVVFSANHIAAINRPGQQPQPN